MDQMRCRQLVFLGAVTFLATGCESEFVTPPPPTPPPSGPAYVTINPATASLTSLGETVQFTATVFTEADTPIRFADRGYITWASSAATVATVNATGLVTAAGNGTARISAMVTMYPHMRDTATVTVASPQEP